MPTLLEKILYYSDLPLLARALDLRREAARREGKPLLNIADVPLGPPSGADPDRLIRYAGVACRLAAPFGLRNTCLPRSLVACRLLRDNGIDARVTFGLRRGAPDLDGHCWIEAPGLPVPPEAASFHELMRVPDPQELAP